MTINDDDIIKKAIEILEKEWGCRCKKKNFEKECAECRARECRDFLKYHLKLSKF